MWLLTFVFNTARAYALLCALSLRAFLTTCFCSHFPNSRRPRYHLYTKTLVKVSTCVKSDFLPLAGPTEHACKICKNLAQKSRRHFPTMRIPVLKCALSFCARTTVAVMRALLHRTLLPVARANLRTLARSRLLLNNVHQVHQPRQDTLRATGTYLTHFLKLLENNATPRALLQVIEAPRCTTHVSKRLFNDSK